MSLKGKTKQKPKILVVDDDEAAVEILTTYLKNADAEYEIVTALSGQDALDMVRAEAPDVILLDIMMPEVTGYEVCKILKSDDKTKKIPVVLVTALGDMDDMEKGVEAGADEFLTKPVRQPELLARVNSMLRVSHLSSGLKRALAYLSDLEVEGQEGK